MKQFIFLILCTILLSSTGCKNGVNKEAISKETESASKAVSEFTDSPKLDKSVLKSDELFLLGNGMYYIQEDGYFYSQYFNNLVLVSGKGEILKRFANVEVVGLCGIIKKDANYYMGAYTDQGYLYGLYDFESLDWKIDPLYKKVEKLSNQYYSAINKEGKLGVLDQDGETIIPFSYDSQDGYIRQIGNRFVYSNYRSAEITILDEENEQVATVPGYNADAFGDYIIVYNDNSQSQFYTLDGNPVFDISDSNITYSGDNYSKKVIEWNGSHYKIYNDKIKMLYEGEIEDTEYVYPQEFFYSVSYNENDQYREKYYDYQGKLLTTRKGTPYSAAFFQYLYTDENDKIEVLDTSNMKRFTIDEKFSDQKSLQVLGENLIGISNFTQETSQMNIYNKKGELLYDGKIEWASMVGDYILCTSETEYNYDMSRSLCMLLNQKGEKIYQSKVKENIQPLSDTLLYVERGDYIGVMDYNGKWIFKTLMGEME